MLKLGLEWGRQLGRSTNVEALEPPPPGLNKAAALDRPVTLMEPASGTTIISEGERTERLLDDG